MIGIVCIKILNTIVNRKHGGMIIFNVERWLSRSTGAKMTGAYRTRIIIMECVAVVVAPMSPIVSVITGIIVVGVRLLIRL